jgi:RimJ/RimL family protein N-acetyltransferase
MIVLGLHMGDAHLDSPTWMPVLETERLLIRPFTLGDLEAKQQLDVSLGDSTTPEQQRRWLEWSVLNYEQLALLRQPPYGDRTVVLAGTHALVGSVGLVPSLGPFDRFPALRRQLTVVDEVHMRPEVGLYWALDPAHRGQGYATEAARALIDYGFRRMGLQRIVATTDYDNAASQAVMRRLGMVLARNPYPDPPWCQIVAVIEHPDLARP